MEGLKKVRFGWRLDIDVELIDNYYEDDKSFERNESNRDEDADEVFVCERAAVGLDNDPTTRPIVDYWLSG